MPTRRVHDHAGGYNFVVEISGVTAGAFKSVEGINAEIEVIEYQDGDDLTLRKRPGRTKFGDVTLKKGFVTSKDLMDWWKNCREGVYTHKDISIILNDNTGKEITRWNLFHCWPKAWNIGTLDGKGNDVVTEEITFVVEDMKLG